MDFTTATYNITVLLHLLNKKTGVTKATIANQQKILRLLFVRWPTFDNLF